MVVQLIASATFSKVFFRVVMAVNLWLYFYHSVGLTLVKLGYCLVAGFEVLVVLYDKLANVLKP